MRTAPVVALLLLLLAGCGEDPIYQADLQVPNGAWSRSFKPSFEFEITDTVSKHDVYIDVRHTGDYPFSDLYLFVDLTGPGGRTARDTVDCILADPTGRWLGRGTGFIFADRIQAKVLFKLGNRFPAAGRYTIQLEQGMRLEPLPQVIDIGVSVMRSQAR